MMEHNKIKELLVLSVYGELSKEEEILLGEHLKDCAECTGELSEIRKMHSAVEKAVEFEPEEDFLREARSDLRAAIRIERSKRSFLDKVLGSLKDFFFANYKFALTGAFTLLIGLGLGYLFFAPGKESGRTVISQPEAHLQTASQQDELAKSNVRIDNLQFDDADASDGEVEFTFDAVKPVRIKGRIDDEMVQKVLAHSLVNSQNDGVRIRTLNAIASKTAEKQDLDGKIKSALISAMKYDKNPGVRREALLVLQKYSNDQEVKQSLIYVLNNDKNAGLRIAAINSLDLDKLGGGSEADQKLLDVLKNKSQNDENGYIRMRAKSALQEVVFQ